MAEVTELQIADGQRGAAIRAIQAGERGAADLLSANAALHQGRHDVDQLVAAEDWPGVINWISAQGGGR